MKPLLLLHGALGTAASFDKWQPLLAHYFSLHTLTFRGHGTHPGQLSGSFFDDFSEDIIQYLDAQNLEQVDIFGYSMGGYAALYTALKHPERVGRIVTLNTKFNWSAETVGRETALLDPDKIAAKVPAFAEHLKAQHGAPYWRTMLSNTCRLMEQLANQPLLTPTALSQITQKVLVGFCDQDHTAPVADNLYVTRHIPDSGLLVLPFTPHPLEKIPPHLLMPHLTHFLISTHD